MVRRVSVALGGTGEGTPAGARAALEIDNQNNVSFANVAISGNATIQGSAVATEDEVIVFSLIL